MDYRLLCTSRALADLAELISPIAEDDGAAARRFGGSLLDSVELLWRFPRMGGLIRKRVLLRKPAHRPVVVYYQLREDKHVVEILPIRHASRKARRF
jgi:plasmid stabilization system protein ParE